MSRTDRTDALAEQVGGDHYRRMAIQPLEYSVANGLGPAEHTVVKYVSRWREKGGVEDLRKAIHTLEILIAMALAGRVPGYTPEGDGDG